MVTARVAAENRSQSYSAGADEYIPKPYTPDQIFQAITDADAWRRQLDNREDGGEIQLRSDSVDVSRDLARLKSLLLARTSIGGPTLALIVAALK